MFILFLKINGYSQIMLCLSHLHGVDSKLKCIRLLDRLHIWRSNREFPCHINRVQLICTLYSKDRLAENSSLKILWFCYLGFSIYTIKYYNCQKTSVHNEIHYYFNICIIKEEQYRYA